MEIYIKIKNAHKNKAQITKIDCKFTVYLQVFAVNSKTL